MLTMIHLYDERNRKKKKLVLSLMIILFSILKCVLCSRKKPELIRLKLSYCASLQHYSQGQISFSRLQCPGFFLFIDINPSFSLLYTYKHTHTYKYIYISTEGSCTPTPNNKSLLLLIFLVLPKNERKKTLNTGKSAQLSSFVLRLFFLLLLFCLTSTPFFSSVSR